MVKSLFDALIIAFSSACANSHPPELPVWQNGTPSSSEISNNGKLEKGKDMAASLNEKIFVYLPQSKSATAAIVIRRGEGYSSLAMAHEGPELAQWEGLMLLWLKRINIL